MGKERIVKEGGKKASRQVEEGDEGEIV